MTPPFRVASGVFCTVYSSFSTASPSGRSGYQYEPNGDGPMRNEPSTGSSVARPWVADCAAVPLAKTHLSNDASDPVADPSKMYSKPGSGGGATYCACAEPAANAVAAHAATMAGAAPLRARRNKCCIVLIPSLVDSDSAG